MTKLEACKNALKYLPTKGVIGMGAGSTISLFLEQLKGRKLTLVCANRAIRTKARNLGLKVKDSFNKPLSISFDGADWIDSKGNLIKGYGKALLKEKIIDYNSERVVIIAEKKKLVKSLKGLYVPVEVHPLAVDIVKEALKKRGATSLKLINSLTENGNNILHCKFNSMDKPFVTESLVRLIPGVIEVGLFTKKNVIVVTDLQKK